MLAQSWLLSEWKGEGAAGSPDNGCNELPKSVVGMYLLDPLYKDNGLWGMSWHRTIVRSGCEAKKFTLSLNCTQNGISGETGLSTDWDEHEYGSFVASWRSGQFFLHWDCQGHWSQKPWGYISWCSNSKTKCSELKEILVASCKLQAADSVLCNGIGRYVWEILWAWVSMWVSEACACRPRQQLCWWSFTWAHQHDRNYRKVVDEHDISCSLSWMPSPT